MVKCGKHVSVEELGITEAKIPEFESLFATTTMVESYDIKRVMKANDLCDRLGLDTISWGVTVAFARECYDRGLLPEDSSDHLEFGDTEDSSNWLEKRPLETESEISSPKAHFG